MVSVVVAAYGGCTLYNYAHKPRFDNEFGFALQQSIAPTWLRIPSQVLDEKRHAFFADYGFNVLLAIDFPDFHLLYNEPDDMERIVLANWQSFTFRLEPNSVMIVTGPGKVDAYRIGPGMAAKLFQELRTNRLPDRMPIVLRACDSPLSKRQAR